MRKNMKKFLVTCALLLTLFAIPVTVSAATKKAQAKAAYKSFLNTSYYTSFATIYLNNDSVPELLAGRYGSWSAYTYKGGKMVKIAGTAVSSCTPMKYYKKKGVLLCGYAHANRYAGVAYDYYYKLSGTTFTLPYTHEQDLVTKKHYYYNDKSRNFTKTAFYAKIKTLTGGKKATKITVRDNTAANREKYLK